MTNNPSKSETPTSTDIKKSKFADLETEVLGFWRHNKIFEKSLAKLSPKGDFIFYDGPPFATGLPHYGHILVSTIKDAVPRYKTMRGFHVSRRWGWDCHGLPIENIVENDLKISGRKQIEEYGVGKFNEYARSKVLTYVHEWKRTIDRIGRWVDFDGSYKTMDNSYIESVWWAFKELYEKDLIYEGTRVLPYCPRCETPIANSEIAMDNSYKDIKDISVYAMFKIKNPNKIGLKGDTFLLAWTTTPWTLPGNFALAVGKDITYISFTKAGQDGNFIVASDRAEAVMKGGQKSDWKVKGVKLIGLEYEPLFNYFVGGEFKNKVNAWKVYDGDFVTTADGTGIVHIAPGYGEDDMKLAEKEKIPFIHHVNHEGKFTSDVTDFVGRKVKPKGDHQSADVEILKYLSAKNLLFAKETITHSYPHCYRCETPLFYFAIPAWFVKIQGLKKKLISLNKKINWIPDHLKHGRFEKGLEGAPDWNISRNRFWASPLPIWRCENCKNLKVVGSVKELEGSSSGNTFILMRHGESENNVAGTLNSNRSVSSHLTKLGIEEVEATAGPIKKKKGVDLIFASPFMRTRETAEKAAEILGYPKEKIIYDDRLVEPNFGTLDGAHLDQYFNLFKTREEKFTKAPNGGEDFNHLKIRVGAFLSEIDKKYSGKRVLVVSHEAPIWMMVSAAEGFDIEETLNIKHKDKDYIENAEPVEVRFKNIPRNQNFEADLHRPYVDEVKFVCKCGSEMKRISEVIDCWFESGSMPFASNHYPFENNDWKKKSFPADFVAEYVPQTRTWFYYMHVLSAILFGKIPFKNVLTHGTILAEDGQKMSKSKGNFPDPWIIFDKYGVDALRFYLLSSQTLKAEDLNFSERGVDEISKKVLGRLDNVLSFYKLYMSPKLEAQGLKLAASSNILDKWIIARFNNLTKDVTEAMERYELDKATRPIADFVDDLSTWYLRRSRDRFKGDDLADKAKALETTRFVLNEFSKIVAPFIPFYADTLYKETGGEKESVHLENWPDGSRVDDKLLSEMKEVRRIVSLALEARAKAGIKVRQPLAKLKVKSRKLKIVGELAGLIVDEVNVKEVVFDDTLENEVDLDTEISSELREEGSIRDIIRAIQEMRKSNGLTINDRAVLTVDTDERGKALISKYEKEIKKTTLLSDIDFTEVPGELIKIDDFSLKLSVSK